jgi:hypothetical protein
MVQFIKANGQKMVCDMVVVFKSGVMAQSMKDTGAMIWPTEKVD